MQSIYSRMFLITGKFKNNYSKGIMLFLIVGMLGYVVCNFFKLTVQHDYIVLRYNSFPPQSEAKPIKITSKKNFTFFRQFNESRRRFLIDYFKTRKPPSYTGKSYKTVHLDLKGAPPSFSYLRKLLPHLAKWGCDSLLVEYEDMFPYYGPLKNLSSAQSYSRKQVKQFLKWAKKLNIEVIPLVQIYGQMEFVLKLEEFSSLREISPSPQLICPKNPQSLALVIAMIEQIMQIHQGIKYIHLGGSDVDYNSICSICRRSSESIWFSYSDFIWKVVKWIKTNYNVQPIIWNDIFRRYPKHHFHYELFKNIHVMIKSDNEQNLEEFNFKKWEFYGLVFPKIWIAGTYKGNDLQSSLLPNISNSFTTQILLMNILNKISLPVQGFVLTGKSRSNHFSVLSHLLPVTLPSLMLNLIYIQHSNETEKFIVKKWSEALRCSNIHKGFKMTNSYFNLHHRNIMVPVQILDKCNFIGSELYYAVQTYEKFKTLSENHIHELTDKSGIMTKYNIDHNFTNNWKLVMQFSKSHINDMLKCLKRYKAILLVTLNKFIDKYSAEEWIEQNVFYLESKIKEIFRNVNELLKRQTWPRRPVL